MSAGEFIWGYVLPFLPPIATWAWALRERQLRKQVEDNIRIVESMTCLTDEELAERWEQR